MPIATCGTPVGLLPSSLLLSLLGASKGPELKGPAWELSSLLFYMETNVFQIFHIHFLLRADGSLRAGKI